MIGIPTFNTSQVRDVAALMGLNAGIEVTEVVTGHRVRVIKRQQVRSRSMTFGELQLTNGFIKEFLGWMATDAMS
jgi:hypothetical protein